MKNYLAIWRIFVFVVVLSLYFFNVISKEALWTLVVGFLFFVMLPEIIMKKWKKRHNKIKE